MSLSVLAILVASGPTIAIVLALSPVLLLQVQIGGAQRTRHLLMSLCSLVSVPLMHLLSLAFTVRGQADIVWVVYGEKKETTRDFEPGVWIYSRLWIRYGMISRISRSAGPQTKSLSGIVVIIARPVPELERDRQSLLSVMSRLKRDFGRAKAVALAGRLPSIVKRAGATLEFPIIDGQAGTVCMAVAGVRQLRADTFGIDDKVPRTVGVLGGGGHVGSMIVERLRRDHELIVVDKKLATGPATIDDPSLGSSTHRVTRGGDPGLLRQADLVLVFTPSGDDVKSVIGPAARPGQAWCDDTHPQMRPATVEALAATGASVTKLACKDSHFKMWPAVPGFRTGWLPGCLVTAIMVALHPEADRQEFENDLDGCERVFMQTGFQPICKPHNQTSWLSLDS